jgi:septal ring factor EnvC (AmiA/AmiB activator)
MEANRKKLAANKQNVQRGLNDLQALNHDIRDKRHAIDTLRRTLQDTEAHMALLGRQIDTLQRQLDDRKQRYVKSLRYMRNNRSAQSKMMFVFSADNFTQMYRRMRFTQEYAAFQKVQGEAIASKRQQLQEKLDALDLAKRQQQKLLKQDEQERLTLEEKQSQQEKVVASLKKQQKTIETIIAEQQKKNQQLNQRIDQLIQEELARQEALRRKREAEEAERRRKAELARQQQQGEQARRSGQSGKKSGKSSGNSVATEPDLGQESRSTAAAPSYLPPDPDRLLSGSFRQNKGRLPMPITGSYRIVSHFGRYNVEGLRNVSLDNKGIGIQGQAGCQARAVFDGEVSYVFQVGGLWGVMVRHGSYISVYCNLSSVHVTRGQKVKARQPLGSLGGDYVMQFQLHQFDGGTPTKLNPELWLAR